MIIKIDASTSECSLEIKLNPLGYFYPWLSYSSDPHYDADNGYTEEQFKRYKEASIEMQKMIKDEIYKRLFEIKVQENIESFLRRIEYEVEIEYKKFIPNGDTIPVSPFKQERSILDKHLKESDANIFKFLREKGLFFLGNKTILSKIQRWSDERNNEKLKNLKETIEKISKIKPGPMPTVIDEMRIIAWYPILRKKIKKLKEKVKSYEKKIRRESTIAEKIISEYQTRKNWWFKYLEEVVKQRQGEGKKDLINYLRGRPRSTPPGLISMEILAKVNGVKLRFIEEIMRNQKKILKDHEWTLQDLADNYRDIRIWS